MKSGEASGLVCGCRGDSRVNDVLVSHRGDREDDLLLRGHGSTATTSPRQPAGDDEWPQLSGCCDITGGGATGDSTLTHI